MTETIQNRTRDRVAFNPSSLRDPVALQTEWTPTETGGANFRSHKLIAVNADRLEFRATLGAKLLCIICVLVGLVCMGLFSRYLSFEYLVTWVISLPILLVGLSFAGVGLLMYHHITSPIVFDKLKGVFWRGRRDPDLAFHKNTVESFAKLDQIHAIQIIDDFVTMQLTSEEGGTKSTYESYELNLVLVNSQRINLVDQGALEKLREDAATLSRFLGKPVWDALPKTENT